ncbi:hypothetical protein [Rhizobium sp. TRM95796]|uniref:hypothetical protein n=1 Tax=Rhizobium sp. TRM95796 TaxID=2979862 RepID=UPI0021E7D983|nr:hypothetical protein [Rhizobium sp. TRM95796]MCV3768892.1 hypothetical protein [Rhizobium sp. TRM95796]
MVQPKKFAWDLFSPATWLEAAMGLLVAIFGTILRVFGHMPPPRTEGFKNTQISDVEYAERSAKQRQAAIDAAASTMSPAEVVRLYARADATGRATMDLSILNVAQQDWLLQLSDDDLVKLGMSSIRACARSLEAKSVKPAYTRPRPDAVPPAILKIPTCQETDETKRQVVATRFRELLLAPGAANANSHSDSYMLH